MGIVKLPAHIYILCALTSKKEGDFIGAECRIADNAGADNLSGCDLF